jgi:amino acid adenylation domain-containing protein
MPLKALIAGDMKEPLCITCLLVGESNLLLRCAELLASRQHHVLALVSQDAHDETSFLVYRTLEQAIESLDERPDVLFSIVNRSLLSPQEIAFPRLAAINCHDSPLPVYAGVNAPSWAILNGESTHGVSWHLMTADVDAGHILVQRSFFIEDNDTALSLSVKCFENALLAFVELLDRLEAGEWAGHAQNLACRSYFSRSQRLPRQGIVSWQDDACQISRFIRSGQFGSFPNDFGLPKILLPDHTLVVVGHAESEDFSSDRPSGTVVRIKPDSLFVVAGDALVVRCSGLVGLDGEPILLNPELCGSQLPILSSAEQALIDESTVLAASREDAWRGSLRSRPAPLRPQQMRPYAWCAAGDYVFCRDITAACTVGEAMAPVLSRLIRQAEPRRSLIGVFDPVGVAFMPMRYFVCETAEIPELADKIDCELASPPVPVDLPARFPELRRLWSRVEAICVCLSADLNPPIDNPGLLICADSSRLILRFASSQIAEDTAEELAGFLFDGKSVGLTPAAVHPDCIHHRISAWSMSTPHAVAIECGLERLSYVQLEGWSDSLSVGLREHGAAKECLYAILLPQGLHFPVAVLAVLKSGAAFVPLDISSPLHRLRAIVRDAKPLGVITNCSSRELAEQLSGDVILVDAMAPDVPSRTVRQSDHGDLEDLAYVLYTSGSTGKPKGCMIEHRAIAHFIDAVVKQNKIVPRDRVLQLCSIVFDASVEEIFSTLCAGATLVVRPPSLLDSAHAFLDFCESARLTIIGIYASMLGDLVIAMERRGRFPETVRLATTGGEAVRLVDVRRWQNFFSSRMTSSAPRLLNVYGLTETTVANLTADLSLPSELPGCVAVGRPLPGNRIRVVDEQLNDVPPGHAGELLLAGPQLARAYWNRPTLTAQRFLPDAGRGGRWFRTGDRVRVMPSGNAYFVGRIDRQVKVNGIRVELEEIERIMLSQGQVTQAAVVLHGMTDGRQILVGFFAPTNDGLAESLRRHLSHRLPEALVPRRLIGVDHFPVNDRGKTDHALLSAALQPEQEFEAGFSLREMDSVRRLWHEFLPWSDPGNDEESFFDLGGDSLLALQLLLRLEQDAAASLPVSSFARDPTIAGLRRLIQATRRSDSFEPLLALQPDGVKTPIYILHGYDGDVSGYSELLRCLVPNRPVFAVRSRALVGRNHYPPTFHHAVSDIAREIGRHRPDGPWILMGYSWAGVLCYEAAVRLSRDMGIAPTVILLDAFAPLPSQSSLHARVRHFLRHLPGWALHVGPRGWLRVASRTWNGRRMPWARSGQGEGSREPSESLRPIEAHFLELPDGLLVSSAPSLELHLIRATQPWMVVTPLIQHDLHKFWPDYGWHRATAAKVCVHPVVCAGHLELLRSPACRAVADVIEILCVSADLPVLFEEP